MTDPEDVQRTFVEQRRRAVRYERFLLLKGLFCLLAVILVALLHELYLAL